MFVRGNTKDYREEVLAEKASIKEQKTVQTEVGMDGKGGRLSGTKN